MATDMLRIIESLIEIPPQRILFGAGKEWRRDHAASSRTLPSEPDDPDDMEQLYAIQKHRDDDDQSRTNHVHGEEENGDGPSSEDEESFAETTNASGSVDDEDDESSLAGTITSNEELNEAKWQSKLELLRQYRQHHGTLSSSKSYEIDGVKLGEWVTDQRVAYKKHSEGKPAKCITQERIDQLTAIGLDFKDTQQKRDGSSVAVQV